MQRSTRLGAAALITACAVLTTPAPAQAANICQTPPAPTKYSQGTPWEDQIYTPRQLAPFATGKGIRVAVIDSGVDPANPQLTGHVDTGADFLHGDHDGRQDCVGHGTGVASIIAAQPSSATGFQGLAPGAEIIPIRISEDTDISGKKQTDSDTQGGPDKFAQAIDWAVQHHVQVINLSLVMTGRATIVDTAIEHAIAAGVVVVAAAGNGATDGNPQAWPASDDGVIGVASVTSTGQRATYSETGPWVDIAAYGDQVTMDSPGSGTHTDSGTSFATPMVSATAALILQRFPGLTPAQVQQRLIQTADPAPGGTDSAGYGWGLLDPYRALTDTFGTAAPTKAAPAAIARDDPAADALAARRGDARNHALLFAAAGTAAVLLAGLAVIIIRQGRRRGWRPATPGAAE